MSYWQFRRRVEWLMHDDLDALRERLRGALRTGRLRVGVRTHAEEQIKILSDLLGRTTVFRKGR